MNSSAGIYIHLPYCQQLCPYCDFPKIKFKNDEQIRSATGLLIDEIEFKSQLLQKSIPVETIYFGGGTPSLFPPQNLLEILQALRNSGFHFAPESELTIEIDPATPYAESLIETQFSNFRTRYSLGSQTFNDTHLKSIGRKHSRKDTLRLLQILLTRKANASVDLLFALPFQTLQELRDDLILLQEVDMPHISAYCLSLPSFHHMTRNQPAENVQHEMLTLVSETLQAAGYEHYEISNYAKPGFRSLHNQLYWHNRSYIGFGLGAHSFFPAESALWPLDIPFGMRSQNPRQMSRYRQNIQLGNWGEIEILSESEALSDLCHTRLRCQDGLKKKHLPKALEKHWPHLKSLLETLREKNLLEKKEDRYFLSINGKWLADTVFRTLTFLPNELP